MPSLESQLESHNAGHFGFSATPLNKLEATEYTLVNLVVDTSGSVHPFRNDLENMLETIYDALQKSPRADNLLVRVLTFDSQVNEVHGFKLLSSMNKGDYKGTVQPRGATALYDAVVNGLEATENYAKTLRANDFAVNAANFIITDGDDNNSTLTVSRVKDVSDNLLSSETVESVVNVLVKVNVADAHCSSMLDNLATQAKMQTVEIASATPSSLAKLGGFISRSISSQSKSLGTGQAAASLTF